MTRIISVTNTKIDMSYIYTGFMILGIMYCNLNVNYEYYRLLALNYLAEISYLLILLYFYETKRTILKYFIYHLSYYQLHSFLQE